MKANKNPEQNVHKTDKLKAPLKGGWKVNSDLK